MLASAARRLTLALLVCGLGAASCVLDRAPEGMGLTPAGPGATVRYDLGHRPLPEIPLPMNTHSEARLVNST